MIAKCAVWFGGYLLLYAHNASFALIVMDSAVGAAKVLAIVESSKAFGFALKEKQIESISSFVEGHDTFVSLPTGYGKSIIYAILPSVFDRIKG